MSFEMAIKIDVPAKISRMPQNLQSGIANALEEIAGVTVNELKATTKFKDRTGNLRNSIHVVQVADLTAKVEIGMEYAAAVNAKTGYVKDGLSRVKQKYDKIIKKHLDRRL